MLIWGTASRVQARFGTFSAVVIHHGMVIHRSVPVEAIFQAFVDVRAQFHLFAARLAQKSWDEEL
eukprot:325949-Lingulodinium_polyedra.AAC.1